MTYSNTNKDKKQLFVMVLITLALLLLIVGGMVKQLGSLFDSRQKLADLEEKLQILTEENVILRQKVEYATSSAAINRRLRGELGVGTSDDYLIELPLEVKTFTK